MNTIPSKAAILGYSGVIPFAASAAIIALGSGDTRQIAVKGFLVYGAVILSFLGGIRWGAETSGGQRPGQGLVIAVLPSLWAAFFLWWPTDEVALWGLMAGFIFMGVADWLYPGLHVSPWMRPLRVRLTLAVVVCHLAVAAVI